MTIKYAGPRPEISQHGIQFKDGKEDKYVYLLIAMQILKAIDKNYEDHKSYSYGVDTKRIPDDQLLDMILKYEPEIEHHVQNEEQNYKKKLDTEFEQIKQRKDLKDIEKTAWLNNLDIMREYRIQRAINKIYYIHSIKHIAQVIKREKIKEIDTPFYEKYWHVLQTIQGKISEGRDSKQSELKIESNDVKGMIAKLFINY
ncbi:MAG: hypothetical protein U9N59_13120 [Campylobacterota bacterium]|nr:hypothetical protein [Campylobacterota bacterium]